MDNLPAELLGLILNWNLRMCRSDKNLTLDLRLVCKAFDAIVRPYILKTVQLDFTRFRRQGPKPSVAALASSGAFCEAVYLDMMIVREEEEINRLSKVFKSLMPRVPEMSPTLESLRQYVLCENSFDERDFTRVLEDVVLLTPNTTRLRLALPFQVVSIHSRTATLLLATTIAAFAKRAGYEEHLALETLVLDHVSDTAIIDICSNPMDLKNFIEVFGGLKNLVISIKRQESPTFRQNTFAHNLWFLIRKAVMLDSLCLVGWNARRNIHSRKFNHGVTLLNWQMRSLPCPGDDLALLRNLRFLELKRIDIESAALIHIIKAASMSLKELYLNEVYLKIRSKTDLAKTSLWIGRPGTTKPEECCWVAEELRNMQQLDLTITRATGLGYDDYESDPELYGVNYDLHDPTGCNRNFDQRFVDAVFGKVDTNSRQAISDNALNDYPKAIEIASEDQSAGPPAAPHLPEKIEDFDADAFQRYHNTTSHFKRSIDGQFLNKNDGALKELQNIIAVADRGMQLLSLEIERARNAVPIPATAAGN